MHWITPYSWKKKTFLHIWDNMNIMFEQENFDLIFKFIQNTNLLQFNNKIISNLPSKLFFKKSF